MGDPVVSVIMTIYNCQRYVKKAIQSILDQTFQDFEFIIVDDGSKDHTWEVVQEFDDKRIQRYYNFNNRKIPFRRNQAISNAKGKYLAIQDGDDISFPYRLQRQVDFLDEFEKVFCVGGQAIKIDSGGKEIGKMFYPPPGHVAILHQYRNGPLNPMIDPTTMFRRKDFNEIGKYSEDEKIYLVPDFELWGRAIIAKKEFANIPLPLIYYRENPLGVTNLNKQKMIRAHMIALAMYLNKRKGNKCQKNRVPRFRKK